MPATIHIHRRHLLLLLSPEADMVPFKAALVYDHRTDSVSRIYCSCVVVTLVTWIWSEERLMLATSELCYYTQQIPGHY